MTKKTLYDCVEIDEDDADNLICNHILATEGDDWIPLEEVARKFGYELVHGSKSKSGQVSNPNRRARVGGAASPRKARVSRHPR